MNETSQDNSQSNVPTNSMPNTSFQENNMPSSNVPENKSSIGSIIGTIIVIAVIILGGLYFWGKRIDEGRAKIDLVSNETAEIVVDENDAESASIKSVTNSDELIDIEADLNSTNLENLGAELQ